MKSLVTVSDKHQALVTPCTAHFCKSPPALTLISCLHLHRILISFWWIYRACIYRENTSLVSRSNDNREDPPTPRTHTHTHGSTVKTRSHPGQHSDDGLRLLGEGNRVDSGPGPARSERSHSVHLLSLCVCAPRGSTLPAPRQDGCAAARCCRDGSCALPNGARALGGERAGARTCPRYGRAG